MKRRYTSYIGALIGLMLCLASMVQAKTTRIGMVYDGESPQCEKIKTLLFNEIQSLTQGSHAVTFPVRAQISGQWNLKKNNGSLDRLMASPEVDMVLVLGEVASHEVCSRRNVLSAQSVTLDAVTAMNDILNRPLSEAFSQEEIDFSDPLGILPDQRLMKFMNNAMALDLLKNFLVAKGRRDSPELKGLTSALAAQGRTLTRSKRAFWSPTISLYGDLSESFAKEGEGSDYPSYRDDTDWSAGLEVSRPLYSGGKKSAELKQAREELSQLEYEYKSTVNRIEKQVLNAVHLLRASYPGIRLSRDAADAAGRNLELVTDAYVRGIKSIIDLIDAQNQYLVADQQAANAVYDFLIDIMTMQRSISNFVLFATPEELDGWMERLQQHMTNAGYSGSGPEKEQNG